MYMAGYGSAREFQSGGKRGEWEKERETESAVMNELKKKRIHAVV